MFIEGLPRLLHADLQRSGAAFLHVLRYAPGAEVVVSEAIPFFDSVACLDFNVAREIALRSPKAFSPMSEYEDDFLYISILMSKLFLNAGEREVRSMLERYQEITAGSGDVRLEICLSLIENDGGEKFGLALSKLIVDYERTYRTGVERDEILEEDWATDGQLFVEGLALLRLARVQGFEVEDNYQFIPSIALESSASNMSPDSWRRLT